MKDKSNVVIASRHEPPTQLTVSLALFSLLDRDGSPENGMTLASLNRAWPRTGMSAEDLNALLARNEVSGDFQTIMDPTGPRIRPAGFERAFLDPRTLNEIEALVEAYQEVKRRRQPRSLRPADVAASIGTMLNA